MTTTAHAAASLLGDYRARRADAEQKMVNARTDEDYRYWSAEFWELHRRIVTLKAQATTTTAN